MPAILHFWTDLSLVDSEHGSREGQIFSAAIQRTGCYSSAIFLALMTRIYAFHLDLDTADSQVKISHFEDMTTYYA